MVIHEVHIYVVSHLNSVLERISPIVVVIDLRASCHWKFPLESFSGSRKYVYSRA